MEQATGSELIARVRSGEKNAFAPLVERYQAIVRLIVAGMIAREDCARELVQEAILHAYLSLEHLRDPERFRSWLYGITLNVCRGYLRGQKVNELSLEALTGGMQGSADDVQALFADEIDPQAIVEERELHQIVLRAVNALPPKERVATLLFYYEQLRLEEIAAILNISVTAVKGCLHRARQQLRERLAWVYEELPGQVPARRRKTMMKATINVVRKNLSTQQDVVVLQDEEARRLLFIWIGASEALVIASGLTHVTPPRPHTVHLMASMMKAAGIQLQEVRVEALKDAVFYAVVKVQQGGQTHEIDARPSDALALAVLLDKPIYVAEEVMDACAMKVPAGRKLRAFSDDTVVDEQQVLNSMHEMLISRFPKAPMSKEELAAAERVFVEKMTEPI